MSPTEACARVRLPLPAGQRGEGPMDAVALEQEYLEIAQELQGDAESRELGDDAMLAAGALYHGGPAQWSFIPKIFSRRDLSHLAWIAETMATIMDKLTRRYQHDAQLRALFGFSPELEALTLSPVRFDPAIPLSRVDIFLDERSGDFKFCELNTDGSSGMLVTEGASRASLATETGRRFAARHGIETFDLYGPCVDTVLACYRQAGGSAQVPEIVAVDFSESIAREEIDRFTEVFAERGAKLRFSDVRDLTYEDGALSDRTGPIDGVWRRAVVSELFEKPGAGTDALLRCVREGTVPIVGSFLTWPCATKTVFAVLHDAIAATFLDATELEFVRDHVPATYLLDETTDLERFSDRARWIAKPRDGYNSIGVSAGMDASEGEWRDILEAMAASGGTVQEYVTPYATQNAEGGGRGADGPWQPYMNMEGLYLFRNRFSGVFTRCGTAAVIGEFSGRLNMGCLAADLEEAPRRGGER